jgi:diaminohydroxyphosphoribosylaminopyrimidine deaminase / 5-amino-6-(5-phosphoribosylamino)uracil reductase
MFDTADRRYMRRALALAEKGVGLSSPNPTVGCIIVRKGEIVGRGWHEFDLLDHAEVRALRDAGERSYRATAYVTMEPCCHQGRTPPCADRLIQAGIERVVVGKVDPNPRVCGQGIERLRSAGIRVDVGLMAERASELIEAFARKITSGTPLVVSKVGMSLDGKIGTGRRQDRHISAPEGRAFGHRLRLGADALLVGIGTVLFDDPDLTYRGNRAKRLPLLRVILDSNLRTPPTAKLFRIGPQNPVLIFCRHGISPGKRRKLEERGAEIVEVPRKGNKLDLTAVLDELGRRDVLELLVEGGSNVHWSFLSNRLVDCFYFIVSPLVLGGTNSIPSVGGKGYADIADSPQFKIRRCFSAGPDIVIESYPSYSRSIISPWPSPESAASAGQCRALSSKRK